MNDSIRGRARGFMGTDNPLDMGGAGCGLSPGVVAVMDRIADGQSHKQALRAYPDFTQEDMFAPAPEALNLGTDANQLPRERIPARHPRAYEAWTTAEENQLIHLLMADRPVAPFVRVLERQPSAIRSSIFRLHMGALLSSGDNYQ